MAATHQDFPIIVKYKKTLAILNICLGGLNVVLTLWVFMLTGQPSVWMITGAIMLFLGFMWLMKPMAVIHADRIDMLNMYTGNPARSFPYTHETIKITHGSVLINGKAVLSNWLADLDLKTLRELVFKTEVMP